MKVSHATLIFLSGLVWLLVGSLLLPVGLRFLVGAVSEEAAATPLIQLFTPLVADREQIAFFLILICLLIGYVKGRKVLIKSVHRSVNRLKGFPNPTSLANIYSASYYLLFGSMVALGFLIKFLDLSHDIRGAIDIAVGAALINGAMIYFREANKLRVEAKRAA